MNSIACKGLVKSFGARKVLDGIDVEVVSGEILCIAGDNGAGKSTLLKIMCGLLRPDAGTVNHVSGVRLHASGDEPKASSIKPVTSSIKPNTCGVVAPYLSIYDEFTPLELLKLQRRLHSEEVDADAMHATLERLGLIDRRKDVVRTLSSGLRQRVVLALAVHREPPFLMLDEPTITLDAAGIAVVHNEIARQQQRSGIVVIATNDDSEKALCTRTIQLSDTAH